MLALHDGASVSIEISVELSIEDGLLLALKP
jgi:hypothetical protein